MTKPREKQSQSTITIGGITIGVLVGAVIGLFAGNMIMGLAIGVAIGIALDIERQSRKRKAGNEADKGDEANRRD